MNQHLSVTNSSFDFQLFVLRYDKNVLPVLQFYSFICRERNESIRQDEFFFLEHQNGHCKAIRVPNVLHFQFLFVGMK